MKPNMPPVVIDTTSGWSPSRPGERQLCREYGFFTRAFRRDLQVESNLSEKTV